jgi:hypothetical protein
MQPCSAASQPQAGPQRQAAGAAIVAPARAWQPQVQPAPGQSTQVQAVVRGACSSWFMRLPFD